MAAAAATAAAATASKWQWNFIPAYDLDQGDLDEWLTNTFGNYNFHTYVSADKFLS